MCVVYILPGREGVNPPGNNSGSKGHWIGGGLRRKHWTKRELAEYQERKSTPHCPWYSQADRGERALTLKCEKGLRGATCLCPLGN